jgi:hypothetical protein
MQSTGDKIPIILDSRSGLTAEDGALSTPRRGSDLFFFLSIPTFFVFISFFFFVFFFFVSVVLGAVYDA